MKVPCRSYWALGALAVVMVLGHICAEAFHAHAGLITTHEEHASPSGAPDSKDDAIHAASCDAVKATPTVDRALAPVAIGTVPVVISPPLRRLIEADASIVVGSPPLFLLHAALLI